MTQSITNAEQLKILNMKCIFNKINSHNNDNNVYLPMGGHFHECISMYISVVTYFTLTYKTKFQDTRNFLIHLQKETKEKK